MKTPQKHLITGLTLLALSTLNSQRSTVLAQGSLTPPGAPAPTMKSLDEVYAKIGTSQEARTPIAFTPFTITAPGSYYLTTNLTVSSGHAIYILANNVALDLNGFTISSTAPSATGNAIVVGMDSGVSGVTIVNGFISSGVTTNGAGNL